MTDHEKMGQEVIDLATVVRPFFMAKNGQIVMSTMALLVAEAILNLTDLRYREHTLVLFEDSLRAYLGQMDRFANEQAGDD